MLSPEAIELLYATRTLLAKGWCAKALARKANGESCHPNHLHATAWCLHGAAMRAAHDLMYEHTFAEVRHVLKETLWDRHGLYLMWCDDAPDFSAQEALAVVDSLLVT